VSGPGRPTKAQIAAAHGRTVPDLIGPGLKVVFCGINPSLYSAVVGHHFARPGNRFWPTLHAAGFTGRVLSPSEERELLDLGCGITNLADRATATAEELAAVELTEGTGRWSGRSAGTGRRSSPSWASRPTARRSAARGPGSGSKSSGSRGARIWLLPNPSGPERPLPAPGPHPMYAELRRAAESSGAGGSGGRWSR
jgi:TDG/mug DNA glycosylase family protein